MGNWEKKKAELEKEVLESQQTIRKYERVLRPCREVTDSEYRQAKKRLIEAATEIHDYEENKAVDPLANMTISQLKELYDREKENYKGGAGSSRQGAKLLRIQTKIQALEAAAGENG